MEATNTENVVFLSYTILRNLPAGWTSNAASPPEEPPAERAGLSGFVVVPNTLLMDSTIRWPCDTLVLTYRSSGLLGLRAAVSWHPVQGVVVIGGGGGCSHRVDDISRQRLAASWEFGTVDWKFCPILVVVVLSVLGLLIPLILAAAQRTAK